jgi:hypothetical protein
MNAGLSKALGVIMKSTSQIADGLAALSIEQLKHRTFELTMELTSCCTRCAQRAVGGIRTKGCVFY